MYSPETLKATFGLNTLACRKLAPKMPPPLSGPAAPGVPPRAPPSRETVVPAEVKGDLVMMWSTPLAELGPYSAAPGPSTNSTCSMSSLVTGKNAGTFTRSEGTAA